ncbi:hypothetical protein BKA66DRAFT_614885 [Pyrenochaeta sp. MPI-SDFR-AT-0127]|nr:hypothetical protein BKA66DRAFT_614885 [Pyrenochaeta sp. MPI-SDFR-AT-0127]
MSMPRMACERMAIQVSACSLWSPYFGFHRCLLANMAGFYQDSPSLLVCILVLAICGYTSMGLRLYTRSTRRALGPDDWCMAYAAFPFMIESISGILTAYYGLGQRQKGLSPTDLKNTLLWFHIFAFFYPNSMLPIKLGIAFQLCRVATTRRRYLYPIYGTMIANSLTLILLFIFQLTQCKPISFNWDKTILGGHCLDPKYMTAIGFSMSAVNITTDCIYVLLPILLLWNIQMSRINKISVGVLLSMAAVASCAAIIRFKYTVDARRSTDLTFDLGNLACWTYAEPGIGYFVGNMATLRPLFKTLLKGRSTNADYGSNAHSITWARRCSIVKPTDYYELESGKPSQTQTHINGGRQRNSFSSLIASDEESQNRSGSDCIAVRHEVQFTHQVMAQNIV